MTTMDNAPAVAAPVPAPETVSWGGPMPAPDGVWRERTSDTMPDGPVWFSNGRKVWFAYTNGSPGAYSAATECKFWMPADVPAAPFSKPADEIAATGPAA